MIRRKLDEGQRVKIHIGPSDLDARSNVKFTITQQVPPRHDAQVLVQRAVIGTLIAESRQHHVVMHSHDHHSGASVITMHYWHSSVRRFRDGPDGQLCGE